LLHRLLDGGLVAFVPRRHHPSAQARPGGLSMKLLLPALALLAAIATPVLADDPGPGGTRPPIPKDGREIYVFYCQACHMADAKGAVGAGRFPALASNPRLGTTAYAISIVEKGRGGMPYFSDSLSPTQVAQVVTYLRTNF